METNLEKSAPNTFYEIAQEMLGKLRWTRTSYYMLSSFLLLLFLIGYVWWPLLDEYLSYFNRD